MTLARVVHSCDSKNKDIGQFLPFFSIFRTAFEQLFELFQTR